MGVAVLIMTWLLFTIVTRGNLIAATNFWQQKWQAISSVTNSLEQGKQVLLFWCILHTCNTLDDL